MTPNTFTCAQDKSTLGKPAKPKKPPPQPNPEAVAAYEAERGRPTQRLIIGKQGVPKRSRALEDAFLLGLAAGGSVAPSAWAAGLGRITVYDWRKASEQSLDPETGEYKDDFCVRWADAVECGTDLMEQEAVRRAVKGVERPVYQQGVMVGTTTEYSDALLQMALRGKRREVYNTERHELTGAGGGPIASKMEIEFIDSSGKK